MILLLISALRAIIEMLGLCLIGQGVLFIVAGRNRGSNRIYQLFDLITKAPRQLAARILCAPPNSGAAVVLSFAILLLAWLGLAFIRKSI